jgi:hypothetical protein
MTTYPEIKRNLWLEFSPHRLIALPIILGLVFLIFSYSQEQERELWHLLNSLKITATICFVALVFVWGTYNASRSVVDEINDATWDWQRLSAQSPWQVMIGKLFGSTLYNWYGGILALAVLVAALLCQVGMPVPPYVGHSHVLTLPEAVQTIYFLVIGALIAQAAALLFSLPKINLATVNRRKLRGFGAMLLSLYLVSNFSVFDLKSSMSFYISGTVSWYGTELALVAHRAVLALAVYFFLLLGIYVQLCKQLKLTTNPLAWLFFLLFWTLYFAGFDHTKLPLIIFGLCCFYLALFSDQWHGIALRHWIACWQQRNWIGVWQKFPLWLLTLPFLIFAIQLALNGQTYIVGTYAVHSVWLWLIIGYVVRDALLVHFFCLDPKLKQPALTACIYLAILYILIPAVFWVLGFHFLAKLFFIGVIFHSLDNSYALLNLSIGFSAVFGQIVLLGWLILDRWKRHWVKIS